MKPAFLARNANRTFRKDARKDSKLLGQGLTEFALAIPILLLILLGVIEMGRLLFFYSSVASASREAARYGAAVDNFSDCTGIRDAARRVGFFAGIEDSDISISYDNLKNGATHTNCPPPVNQVVPGTRIIVAISADYAPVVPLVPVPSFPVESNNSKTIISNLYLAQNSGGGGGSTPPASTAIPPTPQTPLPMTIHVGDIDLVGTSGNWKATVSVTVHDSDHNPIKDVTVNFQWVDGASVTNDSCITGVSGSCSKTSPNNFNNNTVVFKVTDLTGPHPYAPSDNHDPDGDSDGTTMTIQKPGTTAVPPTAVPPTAVPPTAVPPTAVPPTPSTPQPVTIHVHDIEINSITGNFRAKVKFIVRNSNNQPVSGVKVEYTWTDTLQTKESSCTTNSAGECISDDYNVNNQHHKTFRVTNLSSSLPYNPAQNLVSRITIKDKDGNYEKSN
jgi:hypothetical protein